MPDTAPANRNLVDSLLEIHHDRQSGVLRFERGNAKKQLVILEGNLAYAESNLSEEHLALLLVKMKRLTRFDLREITALMKEGKTTDEALLATKKIDKPVLEEAAREQAVAILASLFAWDECEVRFLRGESLTRKQLNLTIPLTELLVLAARRAARDRFLPAALLKLDGLVSQAGGEAASRLILPLDNLEGMVYSLARESTPLANFLTLIPPVTNKPEELLLRLLLLGLLRMVASSQQTTGDYSRSPEAMPVKGITEQIEELLRRYEVADHYEILSISPDSSEEQIKDAYHDLAREYHPDRFQSQEYSPEFRIHVEKLFTYITGAYTILSSPASRASYDEKRLKDRSQVEAAREARSGVARETEKMAETLYRSGRNLISKGEFEQAVTLLKECVWTRPDVARYRHSLGVAESEIPRLRKDAEQHLLKAIELDSMRLETHLALGKLYIKVHLPRRAEAQFLEVLRWDPDHPEASKLLQMVSKHK